MHSLYSIYEKNGAQYLLKLYVEEALPNKGGEPFARAYELKDIEKVADLPNGVLLESKGLTDGKPTTAYSVSDLYFFVKRYDKDFTAAREVSSALLNEDGTPKIFYHGTRANFTEFLLQDKAKFGRALGDGFYFTPNYEKAFKFANGLFSKGQDRGGIIMQVYLQMEDPYVIERDADRTKWKTEYNKGTYDGIIDLKNETYFVEKSTQIKSATDNIGTFDRSNSVIRFSDRDPNLPVTRAELAQKLMELTSNPIEEERLTDYIANAGKLDELQTKLQKLNSELKKLPAADKATDKATKEKIAALRLEAQKTANRLDTYERKLVNLEATAPIKALMQRQSNMAYQRGAQMAERLRGKYTYDRMLDIIKRVGKKLDASKNTERTKEGVRTLAETVVSQSLQFFDKDTGMDAQTMLMGIANMYAELKDSMDTYIEDAYKPEVHLALTELAADLAGKTRQDLTTNELQEMYNVLRAVETSINKAGYLFGKESSTTVRQAAEAVVTEMQAQKQAKPRLAATKRITDFVSKAAWADMKPIYAIRTINSPQLTKMFNELPKRR